MQQRPTSRQIPNRARTANSHQVGYHSDLHPEDAPDYYSTETQPDAVEEDEAFYPHRSRTSSIRYNQAPPPAKKTRYDFEERPELLPSPLKQRRTAAQPRLPDTDHQTAMSQAKPRRGLHFHWLALLGTGAVLALLLWIGVTDVSAWWTNTLNDQTYTQSFRTFSIDQVVGHNHDSEAHPSHFIVQNDKSHIVIIEFPADDVSKTIVYSASYLIGQGQDRVPVTISFQKNAQTGLVDMLLHVEDQTYVFTNNGQKFIPPAIGQ